MQVKLHPIRIAGKLKWVAACLVAISLVAVPLGLAFDTFASKSLWLIYTVDLACTLILILQVFEAQHQSKPAWQRAGLVVLLIATLPWELFFTSNSAESMSLVWLLRLLRLIQLNLLLRDQHLVASRSPLVKRLMRLGINIGLVCHFIACVWLLLGWSDPLASWIAGRLTTETTFTSQYIRSLYWTVTTLTTVGYGDITPGTDAEYLFASGVMLVGASVYAYVIASFASIVGQINARHSQFQQRAQFVTGFLHRQGLPEHLIARVENYYHNRWVRYEDYNQDELLRDLPQALELEVKAALARQVVENVPLLRGASQVIRDRLLSKFLFEYVDPQSFVLREGERNQRIIFVIDGALDIYFEGEIVGRLKQGDYFGNQSLILDEASTASVVAVSYSELMYLNRNDYEEIKALYPEFVDLMKDAMSERGEIMTNLMLKGVIL